MSSGICRRRFEATDLDRKHWSNAGPIERFSGSRFARSAFRISIPTVFAKPLRSWEESFASRPKAWSQNLGHENVLTTFTSYGDVSSRRQLDIMRGMADHERGTG